MLEAVSVSVFWAMYLRLSWISHQKRVQQVQVAVNLVNSHLEWFAPVISKDWPHLVGDLHAAMQTSPVPLLPPPSTGTSFVVDPLASTYYLVRLDLNCPNSRNALVMDKYGPLLASMGKVFGETKFAVLVCMPTRSKEDSGVDPLEDEYNATKKLTGAGFVTHAKIFQELIPPAAESDTNVLHRDAFAYYKVFFLQPDLRTAFSENKWCQSNALLQGKVSAAHTPAGAELLTVTPSADLSEYRERMRVVAATRAAQRGVECNECLVKDLLQGVTTSAHDVVEIVDLHSFNGDLGMALLKLRAAASLKCRVRHWLTEIPSGKNGTATKYASKRRAGLGVSLSPACHACLCWFGWVQGPAPCFLLRVSAQAGTAFGIQMVVETGDAAWSIWGWPAEDCDSWVWHHPGPRRFGSAEADPRRLWSLPGIAKASAWSPGHLVQDHGMIMTWFLCPACFSTWTLNDMAKPDVEGGNKTWIPS